MVVALPNRTTSINVVVAALPGGYQSDRHPEHPYRVAGAAVAPPRDRPDPPGV